MGNADSCAESVCTGVTKLKHQLSARGADRKNKNFLLNSCKSAARSDVDAAGFHC